MYARRQSRLRRKIENRQLTLSLPAAPSPQRGPLFDLSANLRQSETPPPELKRDSNTPSPPATKLDNNTTPRAKTSNTTPLLPAFEEGARFFFQVSLRISLTPSTAFGAAASPGRFQFTPGGTKRKLPPEREFFG